MTAYVVKFGHTQKFDTYDLLYLVDLLCIYFWSISCGTTITISCHYKWNLTLLSLMLDTSMK